jgi:uncharacterized protein YcaQ
MLPPDVLAQTPPEPADAKRWLLRIAAKALGIGTLADLADYWRLKVPDARPLVADLVEGGDLVPVRVEGWRDTGYLATGARVPRRVDARALVSPFDPLVWNRRRDLRLFEFDYRIEIYVPAPQRVYGYYVLPFVLGDRIAARVDVRADRKRAALVVPSAYGEPHAGGDVVGPLAAELVLLAQWLGLEHVEVGRRGDLARPLRTAVR